MLKKTPVVMLPTNEASYICKVTEGTSNFPKDSLVLTYDGHMALCGKAINQHLYFLSDEEIKEEDWCWNQYKGDSEMCIGQVGKVWDKSMKKIIATTDNSLKIETELSAYYRNGVGGALSLPEPSPEFIKKYVERHNKGEQIMEVMVEYDTFFEHPKGCRMTVDNKPEIIHRQWDEIKVNPKDNTILTLTL